MKAFSAVNVICNNRGIGLFACSVGRDVATIIRGGMQLPPTWILMMAIATVALVALAAVLMAHYANQVQ